MDSESSFSDSVKITSPSLTSEFSETTKRLEFDSSSISHSSEIPSKEILASTSQPEQKHLFEKPKTSPKTKRKYTLDHIISKLLAIKQTRMHEVIELEVPLTNQELYFLCRECEKLFLDEPALLELRTPMKVVGDVHGQYEDLLCVFKTGGFPPEVSYLFLGDYVDRGPLSVETVSLLLALKLKYPKVFFMLRGNHESSSVNMFYGFREECECRYTVKLWRRFAECFNCIPPCAVIDGRIFCTHGGLSPYLNSLTDVKKIRRPVEIPDEGLLCDLLWSDPKVDKLGWGKNSRGTSYTFGVDIIEEKLRLLGLDLIVRAHQVVHEGFEFCGGQGFLTVFSAPNYVLHKPNSGAFMNIDHKLRCNFTILEARVNRKSDFRSVTV